MPESSSHGESPRLAALQALHLLDTPLEERFERITRLACRLFQVPVAAITLVDARRQWFKSIQGLDYAETPRDMAICGHTILSDEPLIVPDTTRDARFAHTPLVAGEPNIVFYAGCPLRTPDGSRVGTLCLIDQRSRHFEGSDLQSLRDLAALAETELNLRSLSHTQHQMMAELNQARRQAMLDPLTRLWNRQGILELLDRELAAGRSVCLMLVDVDNFKQINDRYGHLAGDAVLRTVARRLLGVLRPDDAVGRFGGEEFIVVLPNLDTPYRQVAERLRNCIANTPVSCQEGLIPVTISIGVVECPMRDRQDRDKLLRQADAAMYQAKHKGRNRVVAG